MLLVVHPQYKIPPFPVLAKEPLTWVFELRITVEEQAWESGIFMKPPLEVALFQKRSSRVKVREMVPGDLMLKAPPF